MTNKKNEINLFGKKTDVLLFGEILIDMIQETYDIESSYKTYFGGSPLNIAINLKKLGFNVNVISSVGDDHLGDFLIDQLKKNDISPEYINTVKDPTTLVLLNRSKTTPIPIFYRGADYQIEYNNKFHELTKNSSILHFSYWPISKNPSRNTLDRLIVNAKEQNVLIGFDPNFHKSLFYEVNESPINFLEKYINLVDFIKPSLDDADRIFGSCSVEKHLNNFINMGAKFVILTLGKKGLIATDGKNELHLESMATDIVDTTGAGDAFWSGFYAGIISNFNSFESLKIGNALSAFKLKYCGAITPIPSFQTLLENLHLN